ncbi:MAG: hypothetical protein L0I76_19800 [Pseudonocardia sp.]|nr:hypothetical protein [Pseudonocardia sp.]
MHRAIARRARATSAVSRILLFTNTVNRTILRPDAIQYVTRTARRSFDEARADGYERIYATIDHDSAYREVRRTAREVDPREPRNDRNG